ncbi:hypothetical protein CABS03_10660 [Colletotrichum abscissum]|uniref:Uncharacterized protein n=1 Tax=Colletotrichum abscissum TaxID=1671311 RepID=A0A9P9X1X0_9PEZI|nr:hypothetical protein CABS02_13986 [Colletotrichum abscissum]
MPLLTILKILYGSSPMADSWDCEGPGATTAAFDRPSRSLLECPGRDPGAFEKFEQVTHYYEAHSLRK